MKHLPNLLTAGRLVLTLFMFMALAMAAGATPWSADLTSETQFTLQRWAVWAFVIAAVTDFFDGWLARKLNAVTVWGAILDPIGDKVLVAGAVLALMLTELRGALAVPCALILFREFTVSALREVAAGKNVRLPVTMLAKWKTTLQLVALAAELISACWYALGLPDDVGLQTNATTLAHVLLWIAAVVTVWTGAQYWEAARKALTAAD
ncbi:MAG TPA: CDP-diacylglycerol--glycerol-3-phosphate 3-phosphatidyltransferase [Caulobacteraceae bacterium]